MVNKFDAIELKILTFLQSAKYKRIKIFIAIGVVTLIFITQLFFNYLTPLTADDYTDSVLWDTNEKLSSFSQVIPSALYHYQTWSGRVVASVIDQSYLLLDDIVFDFCNSIVFVVFLFLIYYHITGTFKQFKIWIIIGIHFSLWFFIPAYGESFYWLIGSCNYLHCLTIILIYLIPFTYYFENYKNIQNCKKTFSFLFSIPFAFLGALAGDSTENSGIAIITVTALFIVKTIIDKKSLQPWMFTGLIGTIAGLIFLLLSPGQQIRASSAGGLGNIFSWIKNAVFITMDVFDYLAVPLFLLIVVLVAVFVTNKNLQLKDFTTFLVFFIGAGASIYCMIIPPQFPGRAWTVSVVFALIGFGRLFKMIKISEKFFRRTVASVIVLAIICFGTSYIDAYLDLKQTKIMADNRKSTIEQAIENQKYDVLLEPIYGFTKYNSYSPHGDLSPNSEEWPNTSIAKYYGVEKVISTNSVEGVLYANSKQDCTD